MPIKQHGLTPCYATRSFNLWNKAKHFTSEENKREKTGEERQVKKTELVKGKYGNENG
jgi:hypothetical protein